MKGKKLVVFISILAFLTVLIVLNSTLFTLQSVSVNWMTTKYKLEQIQDDELVSSINLGDSIFLINKKQIAEKLEKENPYLRVVGIETKFPNKLIVHSAERETLYAVSIGSNQYAVIDELGKVLDITTSIVFAGNALGAKPIKVTFSNALINANNFVQGECVREENIKDLLITLAKTLRESNYAPTASKGIFVSIDVVMLGTGYEVLMNTRNGMSIKLENADKYTTDKFLLGLEAYNIMHQDSVVQGVIIVTYNIQRGECVARYEPE